MMPSKDTGAAESRPLENRVPSILQDALQLPVRPPNDMIDRLDSNAQTPGSPLDAWYRSAPGRELAMQEAHCVERMLHNTFGYYLLQVGGSASFLDAIRTSHIRRRIRVATAATHPPLGLQIVAAPDQLPIASDSVDAVVLPHTLELSEDAHQVLRETERILIPEGRLIVIGFNTLSLWGLWRLVRRGPKNVPWCGKFLTTFRLGDWLSLLGFDIERQERVLLHPPWHRALIRYFPFPDTLGRRFWLGLGGVYAIRAVKRVATLTPLRPSWSNRRPLLATGAIEPSTWKTAGCGVRCNSSAAGAHV